MMPRDGVAMSASQLSLPFPAHRNQHLFSDYYLNMILPQRADWQQLAAAATPVMQQIAQILAAYTPGSNEAQTEDDLIKPVLLALGHTYEVQVALKTPDGVKKPDYVFYADRAALHAQKGKMLDDGLPRQGGFAVGDAKYWDRPLDTTLKLKGGDAFSNKNPAYQIHFYMLHSGAEWGVLTNGRLWRLYHKETAHKFDRFYEIDLPALIEAGDPARFLYFYAFFHRSAFDEHALGARSLLRASADFARGISENLKQQVYTALRHLAQGFLDYAPNGLSADQATLKTIYDHSLIVLYRLLFVLYAEARDLLPVRESDQYREFYSLHAIKREVARRVDGGGGGLLPGSATFWPRLRELFSIINLGSPPLRVATFNGGLFDPARYPFLETRSIGDARLLQALDMLARVDGRFIDYRDLAERHLGTIYEGLLEYHLEAISPEDGWTVALLNDKGERKATGSYYTPDYIVKYIVDQTVGPALRSAVAGLDDDAAQIRAVLAVNVCDPAMGSGHFLVEATEYIARFLVDLAVTPEDAAGEADLAYWKRRVAQSCIYGVDLNPLAVDLAKLSLWLVTVAQDRPLSFLDHHLRCGNALIGARLADLDIGGAVPKKGKTKKAAAPTAQLALFDDDAFRQSMSTAVGSMWLIEGKAGDTVEDVKEQERIYADLRATLTRKYGRLANLDTAKHFGLSLPNDANLLTALKDYATGRSVAVVRPIIDLLDSADALAAERRFFHWELEFPEVFFDRHGYPRGAAAGFDAVVGNPPYISAIELDRNLSEFEKPYWKTKFQSAGGAYDIYILFIELGGILLTTHGISGLITPNKYLSAPYALSLREHLLENYAVLCLRDVSRVAVFEDAAVYPIISLIMRQGNIKDYKVKVEQVLPSGIRVSYYASDLLKSLPDTIWGFLLSVGNETLQTIVKKSDTLAVVSKVNASTTAAEADGYGLLLIDKADDSNDTWKILNTGLIDRYSSLWGIEHLTHQHGQYLYPRISKNSSFISGNRKNQYASQKIVFAKMALRIEAFIDTNGEFASMNTNFAIQIPGQLSTSYIGALCNSWLLTWVYDQYFGALRMSGGYYQFQAPQLKTLPIRRIAFTTPDADRAALRDEGIALYAAGRHADLLSFCKARLATAPEQSDVVHDILAHLAEQMIDLHKQRQHALEDLLLDLEGVLAPGQLDQLGRLYTPPRPPKDDDKDFDAKQAKYSATLAAATAQLGDLAAGRIELRDDIGAISEAQWKWLLKERLKHKLGSMADLVRVYRNRQPAIAALDQRIAATDRLIDQIVYALYGLTDAEIALVEAA